MMLKLRRKEKMKNERIKISLKTLALVLVSTVIPINAQNANFRIPLNNSRTICTFNYTHCAVEGKYHTGLDLSTTDGNKNVLATNAGKIVVLQVNDGVNDHKMGNTIIIEHTIINLQGGTEIIYSQYSHLASFLTGLYVGEAVVKGQKIGTMGGTGGGQTNYWPVHLHFEIKRRAVLGNPSGSGQYWGYTPYDASGYGYIDPQWLINSTTKANGNDYAFWKFNGNGNREGWQLFNIEGWSVSSGKLFDNPQAIDPYIVGPDIYVDASVLRYVNFIMASNALDGNLSLYFKTASSNYWSEDKRVDFSVIACPLCGNAPFTSYSIAAYRHTRWTGKITAIRIDPTSTGVNNSQMDTIGFDLIRLASSSTQF